MEQHEREGTDYDFGCSHSINGEFADRQMNEELRNIINQVDRHVASCHEHMVCR